MANWDDLKKFTWKEIGEMGLTYDNLSKKSLDELLKIAQQRLDQFKFLPDDLEIPSEKKNELIEFCQKANIELHVILPRNKKYTIKESKISFTKVISVLFTIYCNNEEIKQLIIELIKILESFITFFNRS